MLPQAVPRPRPPAPPGVARDQPLTSPRLQRLRLHLRAVPGLDPLANRSAAYAYTSLVDAFHAEWLRCGLRVIASDSEVADERAGQISEAVEAKPWGVREFTILDPDRNELRFGELTVAEPAHGA